MLILSEGGFTSLAHDELLKSIKRSIENGKRTFLFVPEQQTLTAEKEMCDCLDPSTVRYFEVTNFTRFTNTAFRTLGGISGEYITGAGRALVMWSVLTELSPMLNMTRGSHNVSAGVVSKALAAVNELQSLGIKPDEISTAEASLESTDVRLKAKLSDISLIYALYKNKLLEKFSDMTEDIKGLSQKLTQHPEYLENTDVYIEGFTSFTEGQYELIGVMMKHCNVTVSLTIPKAEKEMFEFLEVRECEKRLISIADKGGVDKQLLRPDAPDIRHSPIISDIAKLLWRTEGAIANYCLQKQGENGDILRIFEANTPFDECDFIAADIKRRAICGAKYSDFAIIVRNLPSYLGILDTALSKASIPHFMSARKSITSFEAIKLISTAYNTIIKNFSRTELMTYVKCGLINVPREEIDLFEIYANTWHIDGGRFTDGIAWNMNPRGYKEISEGDAELLVKLNDIRNRIVEPLIKFRDNATAAKTVREHAKALVDFLLDIDLPMRLTARSRDLASIGEREAAAQNERLWDVICNSLDTVVDIIGDVNADTESFINQLTVVFNDASMGSIPSYLDEVSIGQADMIRLLGKKHVYLVGVNRGEFPLNITDNSYFTERDKSTLAKLGLPTVPDLLIRNARELYSFERSFCFAEETVTLLYTKKTASLAAALPSEVIARISEITCEEVKPVVISEMPIMDKIYSPELALENLGKATQNEKEAIKRVLSSTEYSDVVAVSEGKLENEETTIPNEIMGVILGKEIYLSQSKIDKYMKCPFKYFTESFLKLRETEDASINQLVVGNFIHSVLEYIFNRMISEKRSVASLGAKEREELTRIACSEYIRRELGNGYNSARTDAIIARVCRVANPIVEGLCDEFANCRFTPVCCEMHIDKYSKDTPNSIIYDTTDKKHKVVIEGYIDRVDTLKVGNDVYVRVVDYKTGIKDFSLSDISKGENLQMLLYLKSIVESDSHEFLERIGADESSNLIPAGIVYAKTSVADVTIDSPSNEVAIERVKASFERIGASLDDEASLSAMNPLFTPMEKAARGKAPSPLIYSMEQWNELNDEMRDVILNITDEITNGHVVANPKDASGPFSTCTNCQFKYLCRSAKA